MPYSVKITRVSDGAVAVFSEDWMKNWSEGEEYNWSDGNWSCDCNRADFFHRARKEEEIETECGNKSYTVRIEDESGIVLYEDDK